MTKKDQMMLECAYNTVMPSSVAAPNMLGKPVIITMDMPGAEVDGDASEQSDPGEVDMATDDLKRLMDMIPKLLNMIETQPSLEGWVASKITKATDYINSVYTDLGGEQNEDVCGCPGESEIDMFNIGSEDDYV